MFGGKVRASTALVTWTLVAINVVAFLAEQAVPRLVYRFGTTPAMVASGEWWRLITGAFLHAPSSFFHILFNMGALAILGPQLEMLLGRLRFFALYLLSALGGSALIYLVGPLYGPSIGASGAIFGLFGATFIIARRLNLDTRWIVGLLVANLAITFVFPGISWQAHIGGLVTGLLLATAYAYAPRSNRASVHAAAAAGILLLIMIINVVATVTITS